MTVCSQGVADLKRKDAAEQHFKNRLVGVIPIVDLRTCFAGFDSVICS